MKFSFIIYYAIKAKDAKMHLKYNLQLKENDRRVWLLDVKILNMDMLTH